MICMFNVDMCLPEYQYYQSENIANTSKQK